MSEPERAVIRWPGGPYSFVLLDPHEDTTIQTGAEEGWMWIRGYVIEPRGPEHRRMRTFYVRPVGDGEYELLPRLGG